MVGFEEKEEKCLDKTVLAISPKIKNQRTAEKMAKEHFFEVGARPPPANVKYETIWFKMKIQRHPIRAYIVYNYPAPIEIEGRHLWNIEGLETSLERAQGKFIKLSNN